MIYQGYCYSCGFEGNFESKTECPVCESSNIIIYTDGDLDYNSDDIDYQEWNSQKFEDVRY